MQKTTVNYKVVLAAYPAHVLPLVDQSNQQALTGLGCSFRPKTSSTFELDLIKLYILMGLQIQ